MTEALWIDTRGKRITITHKSDGTYARNDEPLPDGHYAFDLRTWRHVLHGPCDTRSEAVQLMEKRNG